MARIRIMLKGFSQAWRWSCQALLATLALGLLTSLAEAETTRLEELAETVDPGEFILLDTAPGDLLSGQRPDGSSAPAIDTWTDSAYWDPNRQRAFFLGLRISNRFISYDAVADQWEELSLDHPDAPPKFQQFGHLYSRAALDAERGHFYRINGNTLHQYDIDNDRWAKYENIPGGGHVIEWHGGLDQLVNLSENTLYGFRDGEFSRLGSSAVHGYHSTAKYNPVRGDMLLIGGNHSRRNVDILDAGGAIHHMSDAPFDFGISKDNLTHDPRSGNYLVLNRDRTLWEYSPSWDEWRLAKDWRDGDFPLHRYDRHIPIPIDELGIIAWQIPSGLLLYRHESVFEEVDTSPVTETTPREPEPDAEEAEFEEPRIADPEQPEAAPAPDALAGTEIAALAASVPPGSFQRLDADLPEGTARFRELLEVRTPGGREVPMDARTDAGHWDPVRGRTLFQGIQEAGKFISFDAENNAWRELGWSGDVPPSQEGEQYVYGRTALDASRGHYYRASGPTLFRYELDQAEWTRLGDLPSQNVNLIEWHDALDALIALDADGLWRLSGEEWERLTDAPPHGERATAQYNRTRDELLILGGAGSGRSVSIIDSNGDLRSGADAPFEHNASVDNLTYDPGSGAYLVLQWDKQLLWEYNPDADGWHIARQWSESEWPFRRYGTVVPIALDGLGVVLWQQAHGPRLYRHRSSDQPVASANSANDGSPRSAPTPSPTQAQPDAETPNLRTEGSASNRLTRLEDGEPNTGNGLLAEQARTMEPGEWRNIAELTTWPGKEDGTSFKGFQYVAIADGMGWTQNLVHHEGKLMMLLMRDHGTKALMVMEADGTWWRRDEPPGFEAGGRRPFNRLTRDDDYLYFAPRDSSRTEMGYMIRTPLDDPGEFERVAPGFGDTQIDTVGSFAVTWVPEWGRFYALTSGGKVWSWAHGERSWHYHGRTPYEGDGRVSGYSSVVLWNPVREELILMGGQGYGSPPGKADKVARMTAPMGRIEALPDMRKPDGSELLYTSAQNKLIVNPRDGSYLQLDRNGIVYQNDTPGGTWSVYEDINESQPFGRYELYAPYVHVPGTDVIAFVSHIRGLVLHRLKER